jgi:uncharacterized protein with FMN-binding domain
MVCAPSFLSRGIIRQNPLDYATIEQRKTLESDMTTRSPVTIVSLGVIGLLPTLAGCASAAEPVTEFPTSEGSAYDAPAEDMPAADDDSSAVAGTYADGTYTAKGGYQSPNGPETIELTITLAGNVISDVVVTPGATNGTSTRYQGQFAEGVGAETIGKSLDELQVSRISGSSLTSGGFNEALNSIKADARG